MLALINERRIILCIGERKSLSQNSKGVKMKFSNVINNLKKAIKEGVVIQKEAKEVKKQGFKETVRKGAKMSHMNTAPTVEVNKDGVIDTQPVSKAVEPKTVKQTIKEVFNLKGIKKALKISFHAFTVFACCDLTTAIAIGVLTGTCPLILGVVLMSVFLAVANNECKTVVKVWSK